MPSVGKSLPISRLSSVVLPAPLGPTSAMRALYGISTETPLKISSGPKALPRLLDVSRDIIACELADSNRPIIAERRGVFAGEGILGLSLRRSVFDDPCDPALQP